MRPPSLFAAAALLFLPLMAQAMASEEHEHGADHHAEEMHERDAVQSAVEKGEIKSLQDVIATVRERQPGDVVGVEVERRGGAWIYEVRIATPKGRLVEVVVDARTGTILRSEAK